MSEIDPKVRVEWPRAPRIALKGAILIGGQDPPKTLSSYRNRAYHSTVGTPLVKFYGNKHHTFVDIQIASCYVVITPPEQRVPCDRESGWRPTKRAEMRVGTQSP